MRTPVFSHEQLLESILLRSFQAPSAPYILAPSGCTSIIDPSLSLQSGVVACCNCLKAIRECSPESRAPDVPLLECAGPSNEHAGSSNERAGPSNERAGPSNERAGPSNERAGPSNERAGSGNERVGSSDPRASPSAWNGTGRCTCNPTDKKKPSLICQIYIYTLNNWSSENRLMAPTSLRQLPTQSFINISVKKKKTTPCDTFQGVNTTTSNGPALSEWIT